MKKKINNLNKLKTYMSRSEKLLLSKSLDLNLWIKKMPGEPKGITNFLNTFPSASPSTMTPHIEEWNPFSQRPLLEMKEEINDDMGKEFAELAHLVYRYIILLHESMHVLMWEPFFCGKFVPKKKDFLELSLLFEGFCFWYADFVTNNQIALFFPDGGKVFTTHAVSQIQYHPKNVFKKINIRQKKEILNTYLNAFCGRETVFSEIKNDILVNEFSKRFYGFYEGTQSAPMNMFDVFCKINLFEDYFDKFCNIKNMPTLLLKSEEKLIQQGRYSDYVFKIYNTTMNGINKMNVDDILSVRMRRAIQTRAYYLYQIIFLIRSKNFSSKKSLNTNTVMTRLHKYENLLEHALKTLCETGKIHLAKRLVNQADSYYNKNILLLMGDNVRTSYKHQIMPALPHHVLVSPNDKRLGLNQKKIVAYSKALVGSSLDEIANVCDGSKNAVDLLKLLKKITLIISNFDKNPRSKINPQLSNYLDQFIAHPLIAKDIFLSLNTFNPKKNTFREIIMGYT